LKLKSPLVFLALMAAPFASWAFSITYEATQIAGDRWQYNYSVSADSGVSIEEFAVYFDVGVYEDIDIVASPLLWDPLAIQPDPLLPDDGFADWLAFGGPIAAGETLAGFSVEFDWLGLGLPGSQLFEVINPVSFDVIGSGLTDLATAPPAAIPLPPAVSLFLSALTMLLGFSRSARVIPPFLRGCRSRTQAAMASFCAGVMPPSAMFGRS
jgi:hypothetical protein